MCRLRARTDYKPVGSEGAYDLIKLLGKLPNLGELRYGHVMKSLSYMKADCGGGGGGGGGVGKPLIPLYELFNTLKYWQV